MKALRTCPRCLTPSPDRPHRLLTAPLAPASSTFCHHVPYCLALGPARARQACPAHGSPPCLYKRRSPRTPFSFFILTLLGAPRSRSRLLNQDHLHCTERSGLGLNLLRGLHRRNFCWTQNKIVRFFFSLMLSLELGVEEGIERMLRCDD